MSVVVRSTASPSGTYEGSDPWAELGLERGASATEIRRAYRKKALSTHPDVNSAPDAAETFKRVQSAYDLVRDPDKLRKWELLRGRGGFGRPRPSPAGDRPTPDRSSSGTTRRQPQQPEYDDAGGDSFGAIFGDLLRGIATAPGASARAVVDDLLDVLERIPDDAASTARGSFGAQRRTFSTITERRDAEDEQLRLVDKLETMLKADIAPKLATARADEVAATARNDVDAMLAAVEKVAGLEAKLKACERQLKIAKRELDDIQRATVDYAAAPPPESAAGTTSSSSSSPPKKKKKKKKKQPVDPDAEASSTDTSKPPPAYRSVFENRYKDRVDAELEKLKRDLREGKNPS